MLDPFDSDPTRTAARTAARANPMTSYVKYPESKPFVNTGWVHLKRVNVEPVPEEPYQPPSKAFPESNRDRKSPLFFD